MKVSLALMVGALIGYYAHKHTLYFETSCDVNKFSPHWNNLSQLEGNPFRCKDSPTLFKVEQNLNLRMKLIWLDIKSTIN